MILGFFL